MILPRELTHAPVERRLNLPCCPDAGEDGRKLCIPYRRAHRTLSICAHRSPEHDRFYCSRPEGHSGPHVACNDTIHSLAVWDNDGSPGCPRETDEEWRHPLHREPEPPPVDIGDVLTAALGPQALRTTAPDQAAMERWLQTMQTLRRPETIQYRRMPADPERPTPTEI